mmetsp:Transcript_8160/g.22691  ORF Transcript_8160/g.22691 Transcript_8160/m.22691 type:complete len:127 (+) Transcript_8160:114-494(+)|eukprot:CAMPEP_0181042826 /NCGR_PEP_ID=MMETSP1070-20121207/12365_1 /TAXON_ID=265543 /ORGANISM="Minutocellus polymorphus, Strain NH13" /LENGTH=126 /DNA_ID=CAMNT_0023121081 /DNA_START=249 /DNA_END=629 /DNA_ORIENTATION=+
MLQPIWKGSRQSLLQQLLGSRHPPPSNAKDNDCICDSSDDEEEDHGLGGDTSSSFAQFSVWGNALICSQRDDGTIITDLRSTADLFVEDETVTTDNRTPSTWHHEKFDYYDSDEDIEEGRKYVAYS